ncbi:hypothetical protein PoB_004876200 [Plakobranchus ocellatus]|uniref:Uncharacterized protein n=1 Tax=Plakobranchus ocellatus TaxID=259542 RepID=A0AAV4BSD4_9GAST|nr:hypothetical protein PoB_004876200 [Plakobranchus ocellatus]
MGEDDPALKSYRIEQKEFYTDVTINNELSHTQQRQAKDLLAKISGALNDLPGTNQLYRAADSAIRPQAFRSQTIFYSNAGKRSSRKGSRQQARVRNNKTIQLIICFSNNSGDEEGQDDLSLSRLEGTKLYYYVRRRACKHSR